MQACVVSAGIWPAARHLFNARFACMFINDAWRHAVTKAIRVRMCQLMPPFICGNKRPLRAKEQTPSTESASSCWDTAKTIKLLHHYTPSASLFLRSLPSTRCAQTRRCYINDEGHWEIMAVTFRSLWRDCVMCVFKKMTGNLKRSLQGSFSSTPWSLQIPNYRTETKIHNFIMKTWNNPNTNELQWSDGNIHARKCHEIGALAHATDCGNVRIWRVGHHYPAARPSPPPPPARTHTNTHTHTARTVGAWASWFPYAAFRDALSRTWATWGSLGTGKSHSNSGLKICLPPSQHGLNINSFMLAICKGASPSRQNPVCVFSDLSEFVPISNCFENKHRPFIHAVFSKKKNKKTAT